ncbi:MarR family winged helix-turn-helix transcriptional regulator [Planotetraspora mira]|uniref:Transcriptional regulator n=1 Tax=Planotetraspora mira TaxID=58121 RepID=A0A8J3TNC3_9ACTN|nr:MarR family transcriptional regulator [Planotetraspora mira]GII29578.1 transcriptional regulator [Planotetraspora mira]
MDDTDFVVMAWRELLARHAQVSCALDRELGDKHGLGVSEFEVLDRMAEARSCGDDTAKFKFRVQELADQVHLSQSAMSRLIARLEREGLVARAMCADDRRGVFVQITEEGLRRQAEAAPTHRAVLSSELSPHLANVRCLENEDERSDSAPVLSA